MKEHRRQPAEQVEDKAETRDLEAVDQAAALRLSVAEIDRQTGVKGGDETVARAGLAGTSHEIPYRAEMEEQFGTSFEHVRAHTGREAAAASEAMGADAFTFGRDVGFRDEAPSRETVAHELTHVVQQSTRGAGSVERDESEAESAAAGGAPMVGVDVRPEAMTVEPEVRLRERTDADADRATGATHDAARDGGDPITHEPLLDDAQIASAIAYNDKRWQEPHRSELIGFLRGGARVEGATFEARDVLEVAKVQKRHGAEGKGVDGKIGPSTAATLLGAGMTLSAATDVEAKDVQLMFYPGEFEDLGAWNAAKKSADAIGAGDSGYNEYRQVSRNAPEGHGTLYAKVNGNVIDRIDCRGGPPIKLKDGTHSADPSKAGSYTLGEGKSHVTSSWMFSQIAWGAEIRQADDGEIQFKNPGGAWKYATGPQCKLKHPFEIGHFYQSDGTLMTEWKLNDFGETAFRVQGSPGLFIHTTPSSEEAHELGADHQLAHSHGCLHVQPGDRNRWMQLGYMQKGVRLVIHKYDEALDMGATNK